MVFNAILNIISFVLWCSVYSEGTGVPTETTYQLQVTDTLHPMIQYRVHLAMSGTRTHNISGDRH